ncbi:MAG: PhnD/SsuA/transferrin family substrate-binding protein [Bermanella sp.]
MGAHSCESPYELKVGAFFNSASIVSFWSEFAQTVTAISKCQTKITPSPSFEAHIISLVEQDGDMFLVPAYYAAALKKFGLKPILRTIIPTRSYLVTKKELDPLNIETLSGKRVSIISRYSDAYLAFIKQLEAQAMTTEDINFSFEHSLESNALSVIKGETDAAVIFSMIFDPLPDALKRKVKFATLINHETAGYLLIKENTPIELIKAIKASYGSINLLKWEVFEQAAPKTIFTDAFSSQIPLIKNSEIDTSQ